MSVETFPFAHDTPNTLPPQELDARYETLHALEESTYYDQETGLTYVWRHSDVKEILEAETPGISKDNSLDPLYGFLDIAKNPLTWPSLVRHLVPFPAKATANNMDHDRHAKIWAAMAGPEGYFRIPAADRPERQEAMQRHFDIAWDLGKFAVGNGLGVDISGKVAPAFAARVMTEWVGLPEEQAEMVEVWSRSQSGLLGQKQTRRQQAEAVHGLGNLFTASKQVVRLRRKHPAEDFATHMLEANVDEPDVIAALANALAAGVFTMSGTIEKGAVRFLSDPDRIFWNQLPDPGRARAIGREVLRAYPGLIAWKGRIMDKVDGKKVDRLVLKSGTAVPPGPVLAMIEAANRDPAIFENPSEFRPGRPGIPLTFGQGDHICPGQWIARLGIDTFFAEMHSKAPDAQLLPCPADMPRQPDLLFSGAEIKIATS